MSQLLRKSLIAVAVAGAMTVGSLSFAQTKPAAPAATATAPTKSAVDAKFKSEKEKFGYLVGSQIAQNLAQIKDDIDVKTMLATLQGALAGAKPLLTDAELGEVRQEFSQKLQAEHTAKMADEAKKNQADGDAYLAKNKTKPGVKVTDSGLQYEVIKQGTGPKPKATDIVKVEYVGTKVDGTKFDASADHGGPATFPLNGVIPGWTEGVQLMAVGSEFKFVVPAKLAYADKAPPMIGPNAALIFDVTLVGIEPPAADAKSATQPVKKDAASQ